MNTYYAKFPEAKLVTLCNGWEIQMLRLHVKIKWMVPRWQIALGAADLARGQRGAETSSCRGRGVTEYEFGIRLGMGDGGIQALSGVAAGAFLGALSSKINGLPLTI